MDLGKSLLKPNKKNSDLMEVDNSSSKSKEKGSKEKGSNLMEVGKSSSKSNKKVSDLMEVDNSSSNPNKKVSDLMDVSKDDDKLKSYYVISSKAPSHTQDAYIAPIDPRLNTLQNQAGRFNANIEDVCNRNYRNEANTMPAQDLHKIQPPIPSDHFFAKRDYFTGFTIFQPRSKRLKDLIHAIRIDMNHTFAANTSAMYGFTLNYSNINEYFKGIIAVMPTLKYANQSIGAFGYVAPEPSYLVPESRWGICPLPVGSQANIRKIEGSVYGLKDFLPLFSKSDIKSVTRVLTAKIEHCREIQMEHITNQLESLKKDSNLKSKETFIKETKDIIAQWKKDADSIDARVVADEIMKDENVGELRQVMCRLTLNRIHPLLDKQDKINSKNFAALATAVENIDNTTTSNTKITKSYIDLKDGKEKTEYKEIKDVEINITAPSLGPNTEALTSAASVFDELRLIGSDSILAEAISSAHGRRQSKYKHHLQPGNSNIGFKPHKPVEKEIKYEDILDKSELFAAIEAIKKMNKTELFPKTPRLKEDFFPKIAAELQKGFVYKELDNGDKLKVVGISNDEAMILAEEEAAANLLSVFDSKYGYMSNAAAAAAHAAESSVPMDKSVSNVQIDRDPVFEIHERGALEESSLSPKHISSKNKLRVRDKPPPKPYMPTYDRKKLSDADPLKVQIDRSEKFRKEQRAEQIAKKREKKSKSRSPDNMDGGKRKTRKNRC